MSYTVSILIRAVDRASSVFRGLARTMDRFGLGLAAVEGAVAGLALGITTELLSALQRAAEVAAECVEAYSAYELTLMRVATAAGAVGRSARALSARLDELARRTGVELGVGATRAAEALEALVKAGLEGQEAVEALEATLMLAQLELLDTGEAANLVAGILRAFSLSADQAAHVVDVLVNASIKGVATARDFAYALSYCSGLAAQLGLSLEETVAALVAMNNQGIQATYAGRYLMAMLTDLIEHSDELGFSIYDASGRLLSLSEIIARLEARLDEFSTDEERAAYLAEIFGARGMRAALALLHASYAGEEGSEALEALARALGQAGTAEAVFEEQMKTLAGVVARARARIQEAMLTVGEALAPAAEVASEAFSNLVQVLAKALAPVLKALSGFLVKAMGLLEKVASYASEVLEPLGEAAVRTLSLALETLGDLLDKLSQNEALVRALGYAVAALVLALNPLLAALAAISLLMEKLEAVGEDVRTTIEGIREALEALVRWLRGAEGALSDFFGGMAEAAEELYEELVGHSIWPELMEQMSSLTSYHMGEAEEAFTRSIGRMEEAAEALRRRAVLGHAIYAPGTGRGISIHIHIGSFTARGPEDVELLAREVCRHLARELRLMGVYVA